MTRRNDSKLEHRLEENRLNDARRRENEEKRTRSEKTSRKINFDAIMKSEFFRTFLHI